MIKTNFRQEVVKSINKMPLESQRFCFKTFNEGVNKKYIPYPKYLKLVSLLDKYTNIK